MRRERPVHLHPVVCAVGDDGAVGGPEVALAPAVVRVPVAAERLENDQVLPHPARLGGALLEGDSSRGDMAVGGMGLARERRGARAEGGEEDGLHRSGR
jgi:hypothetical protein